MRKLLTTLLLLALTTIIQAKDKQADVMTFTDTTGKVYKVKGTEQGLKIEGLEGKIIFLEFFGHKCPPCLASIPHLIDMQKKHKDKLAVVSIEVQGYSQKQTTEFVKDKEINYIVSSEETAAQFVLYIQQRAQWNGSIPFLVATDTNGDVQFVKVGLLPESSLEELFIKLSNPKKAVVKK